MDKVNCVICGSGWNGRCDPDEHRRFQNNSPTRLQDLRLNLPLQNQDKIKEKIGNRVMMQQNCSKLKVIVSGVVHWLNCTIHGKVTNKESGLVFLHVKIGKRTMWVPASEVILGSPINSIDLK